MVIQGHAFIQDPLFGHHKLGVERVKEAAESPLTSS